MSSQMITTERYWEPEFEHARIFLKLASDNRHEARKYTTFDILVCQQNATSWNALFSLQKMAVNCTSASSRVLFPFPKNQLIIFRHC
jgi:hypothetical protein